jgi:hypothetical protein
MTISLLGLYNCGGIKNQNKDFQTIEIIFHDLGKRPELLDSFYNQSGISRELVTSAIYGYTLSKQSEIKPYIIHDKYFNYDYFNKKIAVKSIGEKIKLLGKNININGKEYFIVYEISL